MPSFKVSLANHLLINIALLAFSPSGFSVEPPKLSGDLTIIIEGIRKAEGDIKLSLDHNEKAFSDEAVSSLKSGATPINNNNNTAQITFKNIPYGEYGVKLFHDIDNDNELDTNLLGIPSEPYGISNNARAAFGLPDWKDAKFSLDKRAMTIRVKVSTHLPSL